MFAAVVAVLLVPAVATAATGAIEGEVSAEGGGPIGKVWACAYLVQDEEENGCDFTGSDGLYAVTGLVAGKYKVEFWPESTSPPYVGEYYDDEAFWDEADEVEVKEGASTPGIDAELEEAATLEGEVRAASLGGAVEEFVVCAHPPTGGVQECKLGRPDGTYTLTGLPAGEYKVQFTPSSTYNLLNQFYDHESSFEDADVVTVATGETKTGVDADLEQGAEIRGTVYSAATGTTLAGVTVCGLYLGAEEVWALSECRFTSGGGSYALRGLWTDSYKVAFSSELKELFGEESFVSEDDGYLTQFFNNQPTLASADPLSLAVPEVRVGVDAHLALSHPSSPLQPPTISPALVKPKPRHRPPKRCRPGFRKKKVMGKRRCVKAHKKHRHSHLR
ncbi:MAG TPA: hypothetical protein VF081_02685 [Solirubrobacterales bacterium]